MSTPKLKPQVGFIGATFTISGLVLGVSILILPGELAGEVGPGVFLAFALASIPALFSCFVAAQAANIFPTSGCAYVGASMVLSPFWGFMVVWNMLIALAVGVPLMAFGFAEHLAYFFPGMTFATQMGIAVGLVLVFGFFNLVGVRFTVALQIGMLAIYLAVMAVFCVGGLWHVNLDYMTPLFPHGWTAVLPASVVASFSYGGFILITEMSEDIKQPQRTIPYALAASFLLVTVLYVTTSFVVTGLVPASELGEMDAAVARASERFLPAWFGGFIALTALLGVVTTINAWFLAQSRDIFALARDRVFPIKLARVSRRTGEPDAAVMVITALALVGVGLGATIRDYAVMSVITAFAVYSIISVTVLLAPKRVEHLYARSRFKLGPIALPAVCLTFLAICLFVEYVGVTQSPKTTAIYLALLLPGVLYYVLRKRHLRKQGIRIEEMLRRDVLRVMEAESQGVADGP